MAYYHSYRSHKKSSSANGLAYRKNCSLFVLLKSSKKNESKCRLLDREFCIVFHRKRKFRSLSHPQSGKRLKRKRKNTSAKDVQPRRPHKPRRSPWFQAPSGPYTWTFSITISDPQLNSILSGPAFFL